MDVSVIVSTYNRADSLRDTVESLAGQKADNCSYEIIVVDNNSSDQTKHVAAAFIGKVRYFFEPKQGLSYARNTGIQQARGQVIAFTDDDCVADPDWVASLWNCFKETRAVAVGGKIERLWHCERPDWLSDELLGPLIVQDLGPKRKIWDARNRHMVGANMAFHRSIFERFGLFNEALGRKGDLLIGGEDREIFRRLFESGAPIFYEPKAVVHHKVEKGRLTKEYMNRWFWDIGKTLGHQMPWRWPRLFSVVPVWVWGHFMRALGRFLKSRSRFETTEADRFSSAVWVLHYAAIISEAFAHWLPLGLGSRWCMFHTISGGEKNETSRK